MIETELREASALGRYAAQVVDNPAFEAAFDHLRRNITDRLVALPSRDIEGVYILHLELKLVEIFRGELRLLIEGGKLAEKSLPENNPALKREKPAEQKSPIERELDRTRARRGGVLRR